MRDNRKEIIEELTNVAPELAKLKRHLSSEIPKDYFNHLEIPSQPVIINKIKIKQWQWLSLAASFAILVVAGINIIQNQNNSDDLESVLAFEKYIEDNLDLLDDSDLISLLDDDFDLELDPIFDDQFDDFLEDNIEQFSDSDLKALY